jgi:hypothetical protein
VSVRRALGQLRLASPRWRRAATAVLRPDDRGRRFRARPGPPRHQPRPAASSSNGTTSRSSRARSERRAEALSGEPNGLEHAGEWVLSAE